ncbi:hypothetical protein MKW98_001945 [Papaver atlanticum]|uniref:2-oxoglutarate-dependent dioxygenase DAO n=1 Tax=Papaver atlanticum TaxID=357466 RepID=A0AAD4T4N8_9MAGN|nr:hypothetical protein MKW98_001945 [Papaver atlanticum]
MGFESGITLIDFSKDPNALVEASEGWKNLCKQVKEACENHGCFQVFYEKVPGKLHDEMFKGVKDLFDVGDEIKQKNISCKPHHGYIGKDSNYPLLESLGIENAPILDKARAFTDLMWPNGNPSFCGTLNSMSIMMKELEGIIRKMIFESLGIKKYYDSNIKNADYMFRVMKYKAPFTDHPTIGLPTHTDKNILTILYEDIQGLEVLSKKGQWIHVVPKQGNFLVIVGESLMAWSNGRIHAPKHRVMMKGEKDRYSYSQFSTPNELVYVETPKELVDEVHPLLFRPFKFLDYLRYFDANMHLENPLASYVGIGKV